MNIDEKYMERALQLAALGRGRVSPNPMVGAVVVARGRIIGEGYHRRFGEAHAEVNAIGSVAAADVPLLAESTIYVTLEPCAHYGKTPPCAKLIIDKHIPRVVVGSPDPFREVAGRGVAMLRAAGVEVVEGVLRERCDRLNVRFLTAHTLERPYILLKWAESLDGYIDRRRSAAELAARLSTPTTSTLVHRLRSEYDAILVGAATARLDNPSLTVRRWCGRNPLRVVLTRRGYTPSGNLADDAAPTIVYQSMSLDDVCCDLYRHGVTSLMVEGGAETINAFVEAGLWDEARVERSSIVLGGGVVAPKMPDGEISCCFVDTNRIIQVKKK
ncbi:MAG: bifunctional diaminohydroxyphosphoribosylaminopyrimidine deaminase/5-amino-6-(5-phosphoribosylamino)uracil reductase RibD [Bacteroidales bacterium]|nr:bifunctional diaminohydroxyphosphoribosylaminopyrimidine deaminase/5-amino-6-(5-phosphoribosylamino)uracil reductase RibD [Bacteroidales bacterium]